MCQLVDFIHMIHVPSDEAPVEIVARGPEALRAFHTACDSGTQSVFRTRLMLIGQDRVGKTSLKKALTGQRYINEGGRWTGVKITPESIWLRLAFS